MAKPTTKATTAKTADQAKPDPAVEAKTDAAANPEPEEKTPAKAKTAKTVMATAITAPSGSFRRLGRAFSREPQYFAKDYFDPDEIKVLSGEPNLNVTEVEVDPEGVTVLKRPEGKPDPDGKE